MSIVRFGLVRHSYDSHKDNNRHNNRYYMAWHMQHILLQFTYCDKVLIYPAVSTSSQVNRPVSQIRAPLAACPELSLDYNTQPKLLYVFERKT